MRPKCLLILTPLLSGLCPAAVILENFIEVTTEESQKIDQDKLNEFVEVWTKLDPSAGR
jgi:hypothetical protein